MDGGDAQRWTVLHVACAGGHATSARMLIESGRCDVTLRNVDGLTAFELGEQMGHGKVIGRLQSLAVPV